MNPAGSAANLVQAMKELSVEWDRVKGDWRDVKARESSAQIRIGSPSRKQARRLICVLLCLPEGLGKDYLKSIGLNQHAL